MIGVIQREERRQGHIGHMKEKRNADKSLVRKPKKKIPHRGELDIDGRIILH
jgi:hypothetical protein